MATDVKQRLREAIVAVLDTHAAVVALTGRASGNIADWNAVDEQLRPGLLYHIVWLSENGESGEGWDARVQITAIAEGNNADSIVEELLGVVREELDAPAMLAAGLDAAPLRWTRTSGDTDDLGEGDDVRALSRNLYQSHADVELSITA